MREVMNRIRRFTRRLARRAIARRPSARHRALRPSALSLRAAHRGLTLLEIMIVIAILGLIMGLVVVPKVMDMFSSSREQIAKLAVNKWAFETAPQWQASNPGKGCPENMQTLAQFVGKGQSDLEDPWGSPYEMLCKGRDTMPPDANSSFAVLSYGPDKKKGTEDDIVSWKDLPKK
jgi:general secretion pathway protein G